MELIIKYLNKVKAERKAHFDKYSIYSNQEMYTSAYRGECMDFGKTSNTPSMYRKNININALLEAVENYQISKHSSDFYKMIDSQHKIAISNLLDVTYNVLVGIFFAIYSTDDSTFNYDGKLFGFCFPNEFLVSKQHIEKDIESLRTQDIEYRKRRISNFRIIQNTNINRRVISQSGGFIYFYSDDSVEIPKYYMYEVKIKAEDKKKLLKELDTHFNISPSMIYPEEENQQARIEKMLTSRKDEYISNEKELVLNELEISKINMFVELISLRRQYPNDEDFKIKCKRTIRFYKGNQLAEINKDNLTEFEKEINNKIKEIKSETKNLIISLLVFREA